ncbi:MAG: phosphopentomutase [bacterium]
MTSGKLLFIILDGIGVGALPDAEAYGDQGTNTLGKTASVLDGLHLPNLGSLGIGNLTEIIDTPPVFNAKGAFGTMAELSAGKDSTTGHWELAGIISKNPFPLFPKGFPADLINRFLAVTKCSGYLGNRAASGTEIIKELGDEHVRTGFPIVYTSGDSVFQIAAHEHIIPLESLYEICRMTRHEVLVVEYEVGRVIARPFIGTSDNYIRTSNRRDYALPPPSETVIDLLFEQEIPTIGIGKIDDLFCGRGLRETIHTKSNNEGIAAIHEALRRISEGFIMANLVDFDTHYGHRQDPKGLAGALQEFDRALPGIIDELGETDLLIITADHGNDPTDSSTDHTREYVPVLSYCKTGRSNVNLGIRSSFADSGKTVAEYFQLKMGDRIAGNSFLNLIV